MSLTRESWLAELQAVAAACSDPDGMTIAEMQRESGLSRELLRRMLGRAIEAGAWEMSGTKRIVRIDGRGGVTACYRPKGKA